MQNYIPDIVALKYIHKCLASSPFKQWDGIGCTYWLDSKEQNVVRVTG